MKNKPFFFRIDSGDLLNFATDPEGEGMTVLQLAKELHRGKSDIAFIQRIIDEAHSFSQKKRDAVNKRWSNQRNTENIQSDTVNIHSNTSSSSSNSKELKPMSGKQHYSVDEIHVSIIDYLNLISGLKYKVKNRKTVSLINARIAEGFTLDDFKTVIDKKVASWKHDQKMSKFIRPETLFSNKFEGYLNEISVRKSNVNKDGVNWCGDTIC